MLADEIVSLKQELLKYKTSQLVGTGSSSVFRTEDFVITDTFNSYICDAYIVFIGEHSVKNLSVDVVAYANGVKLTPYLNPSGNYGNACFISNYDTSSSVVDNIGHIHGVDFVKDIDFESDNVYAVAISLYGNSDDASIVYRIEGHLITPCDGIIKTWIGLSDIPYVP